MSLPSQSRVRSDLLRSLDRSLLGIAVAAVLLAGIELSLFPLQPPFGWVFVGVAATFLVYIGAGLLAWHRRPSNPMGSLLVFAGFALFAGYVGNTEVPALVAVGAVLATIVVPAFIHLLLAFPTGRLASTSARVLVVAAYFVAIVLQAPIYLLDENGPYPPFAVAHEPEVLGVLRLVQSLTGGLIMVAVAAVLLTRLVRADSAHRRVLIPVYCYGVLAVLSIPLTTLVLTRLLGVDDFTRGVLQLAMLAGVPVAFTLGLLRGGFARTGELEELGNWLAAEADRKQSLQDALTRTLGDPSARLFFWAEDRGEFVDEQGHATPHDTFDARRGWSEIRLKDRTIGAIGYDASLIPDRQRVQTVGKIIVIAMERQRLTADLLASQLALLRSRERIAEAADRERRRVARDLHDGLQVRLVLLALEAQKLATLRGTPTTTATAATRLRSDIDDAAGELRRLVHDLVPAALIERGLVAAAEDLADRMPIPATVHSGIADGLLSQGVETTAYFVVAEGLANVVKHAEATSARVSLEQRDATLHVSIADDGKGGADLGGGTGLQGLADRVDVLGGIMRVRSVAGAGTVLTVELPCAS